jgi:hypothetical protein
VKKTAAKGEKSLACLTFLVSLVALVAAAPVSSQAAITSAAAWQTAASSWSAWSDPAPPAIAPSYLQTRDRVSGKLGTPRDRLSSELSRHLRQGYEQSCGWEAVGSLDAPGRGLKPATVRFRHRLKADSPTDIDALRLEIQAHVDAWNEVISRSGMVGLKRRLRTFERHRDVILRAGRKYTRSLGPAGEGRVWSHYPDMSGGGFPKSGVDIVNPADARLNFIIGGQMNRLRREILRMSDDVDHLDFVLEVLE